MERKIRVEFSIRVGKLRIIFDRIKFINSYGDLFTILYLNDNIVGTFMGQIQLKHANTYTYKSTGNKDITFELSSK